ncbi:MAG: hypothetical protein ABJB09_04170 [Verrucomicrobiota bacterium]
MKLKLITLTAACAAAFAVIPLAQAHDPAEQGSGEGEHEHGHGHHGRGGDHEMGGHEPGKMFEHMTKNLNLTPDQQAKVQPIIEQAKPQMKAIHQEAMQKGKALMDNVTAQIRALLTPEQQQKLDAMKKAHEDMRRAREEMRAARQQ